MKKKLLLFCAIVCFALSGLRAATIGIASAQTIALNFFKLTFPGQGQHGTVNAVLKYTKTEPDGSSDFYVFDINPLNGFVIVSADDGVIPVIAYSNESYFNSDFPENGLVNWVNKTAGQIHHTVLQQIHADARISNLWSAYARGINPGSAKSSSVGPMLSTIWNQEPYYNMYCPVNPADGQLSVTGCVATAMAQIIKYWNYPAQGTGSFSYIDNNAHGDQINAGTLSANFGATNYQWTQMPNYLTGNNTAVGTLMSQCGISVAMDYSDAGSGAYVLQAEANAAFGYSGAPCAQHSYATYFKYNPNTLQGVFQSNYTSPQWTSLLEAEMNAGRVVQYEGVDPYAGGHTWVCDGYDVNDNLHMNWGWGGIDNGFFAINNLSAGGYTFDVDDAALIGIEPLYPVVDTGCTASASFTYQNNGGSSIQFTNTSTSNHVFSSSWTFYNSQGQFATSAANNPLVTFSGQSPYSAKLTIVDTFYGGCRDTFSQAVTFNPSTVCITLQHGATRARGAAIESSQATSNFDFTTYYEFFDAQWTGGGFATESRSLLQYDLSQIPAGSVIVSAGLSLYADTASQQGYVHQPTYGTADASYLHLVTSSWNPATVTWNTQPTVSSTSEVLLPQSTSAEEDYLNIDISSFVQAWVTNPAGNYGVLLQLITQNHYNCMLFCSSSNADTAKWPKLEICFIPPNPCHAVASFVQQNLGAGQMRFTNTSTDNTTFSSNWTFYNASGQFSTSNLTNPVVTFTGQQPYSATLVITDSICSDTLTQLVNLNNCITFQHGATRATGAAIGSNNPASNFDFTTYYEFYDAEWTSGGANTESRSLMKYDLSQIPVGSVILSAALSLYADTASSQGYAGQPTYGSNDASYLHLVTSNWSPANVTWNTQPSASNTNEVLLPQSTSVSENYLNIDISGFVQTWVNNPSSNYGMLLQMITQNHYNCMLFCSPGNADTTKWPKLEICYQLASPCHITASFTQQNLGNGLIQFTNTSTLNGNTLIHWDFFNGSGLIGTSTAPNPSKTFTGVQPYSARLQISDTLTGCMDTLLQPVNITSCISLQPGLSGDSVANVASAFPSVNQVVPIDFFASQWTFSGSPGEDIGVMKFDLSALPAGAVVTSAALSLYSDMTSPEGYAGQPTYGTNNACYLQQLTSPWSESGITWNNQPAASTANEVLLPQSTSVSEDYLNINITSFVESWVQNPAQNYGMRLKMIGSNYYNSMVFCSSTYPDSAKRPLLQICYLTPSVCMISDSFTYQNTGADSIQFTNLSASSNGYTSHWVFSNANGLLATSTETNPVEVFTGPAPYYAQLTVGDSLTGSCVDSFAKLIKIATGISEPDNAAGNLLVFPNPNNGNSFNLRLPSGYDPQTTEIRVYNLLGKEVSFSTIEKHPDFWKLSIKEVGAAGVYTIVVSNYPKQQCAKLAIMK